MRTRSIITAAMLLLGAGAYAQTPVTKDTTATRIEIDLDIVDSDDSLSTTPAVDTDKKAAKPSKPSKKDLKASTQSEFPDLYLDTVTVKKAAAINDYTMLGLQYGMALSDVWWNPSTSHKMTFMPYNVGIFYTRYGKMFGFMPYFGFQAGIVFTQEGYAFKEDKEYNYTPTLLGTGEYSAKMNIIEVPVLAHCHIDFWKMKLLINAGCFAGYRLSIERYGDATKAEYVSSFTDYDRRFDWGLKAGAGVAFVFDPIEIHIQGMYKHSFQSLYEPDYNSELYYRYAYPYNVIVSVGLHVQLTRRTGKTSRELKQEARDRVYGTDLSTILSK